MKLVDTIPTASHKDMLSAIDVLERALVDAKQGKVVAVGIALVGPDQRVGYMSSESARHAVQLVAAANLMNWRLCESVWTQLDVELEEYPDPPNSA